MKTNVFKEGNLFLTIFKKLVLYFLISVMLAFGVSLLVGYQYKIVRTGSMEPTLHVWTLVAVRPVDFEDVKVGDIVTFSSSDKSSAITYTHRVVAIEDGKLRTKGDANGNVDNSPIGEDRYLGVVEFHSYFIGLVITYIKSNILQCIIGAVIIFLTYLIVT